MGHQGMTCSLASREVIANSVESSVRGPLLRRHRRHVGCDKSLQGRYQDRDVALFDVFEAIDKYDARTMSRNKLRALTKVA